MKIATYRFVLHSIAKLPMPDEVKSMAGSTATKARTIMANYAEAILLARAAMDLDKRQHHQGNVVHLISSKEPAE